MIWKEKRILLIVLALLLTANAIFFLTYRVQYQNRLDELDARLEEAEAALQNTRNARLHAQRNLTSYAKVEGDVKTVFEEHWATREEVIELTDEAYAIRVLDALDAASPPAVRAHDGVKLV